MISQYFLPFCRLPFHSVVVCFAVQKLFSLKNNWCKGPCHPCFLLGVLWFQVFTFGVSFCVFSVRRYSSFGLLYVTVRLPQNHPLETVLSLPAFSAPCCKALSRALRGSFSNLLPRSARLFSMSEPHCFDYHSSVRLLKSGSMILPALLFFSKMAWVIQCPLCFHTNCRIFNPFLWKLLLEFWHRLHWICRIALGSMDMLTIIILPIHECEIFFYLLVSSIFFHQWLRGSLYVN